MFVTDLVAKKVMNDPSSVNYVLTEDLIYQHFEQNSFDKFFKAPAGSSTDWSSHDSVHPIFRGIVAFFFSKHGAWDRGAALHDSGYRHTLEVSLDGGEGYVPFHLLVTDQHLARKFIDKLYYATLRSDGVSVFDATLMYLGVRLGGKRSFLDGKDKSEIGENNEV